MAFGSSEILTMDCCLDLFLNDIEECPGRKSPSVNYGALVGERNSDWRMGYNKKQRLSQWRNSTEVFVDSEKNSKWYDICFQYYGVLTLLQMSNSSSGTSLQVSQNRIIGIRL